ncbi:MAG: hypothetical protein OXC46_10915 [Thaumarchaeota archaeon]|nr:hypothetical protein [Nitrososphaerota archaeon]
MSSMLDMERETVVCLNPKTTPATMFSRHAVFCTVVQLYYTGMLLYPAILFSIILNLAKS